MPRTLYAKLLAVLIGLSVIMAVVFLVAIRHSDIARNQEINQKLYRNLAYRLIEEQILSARDSADPSAVQAVFDRIRVVNPRIDVYLLDASGRVIAASVRDDVKRNTVDLEPLRRLADPNATLPILGDDPSDVSRRRVFSVAPVPMAGGSPGYLYLVLRGLSGDTLVQRIKQSYVLREMLWLIGLSLVIALLASALLIKLVTRPLHQLSTVMHKFRRSGFAEHPRETLPSPRDEIGSLADTFHRMTDRILDQMAELRQTDALRREFVANISHDLRTPLATLQGYLETLNLKRGRLAPEEERVYLQTALRQTEQLSVLVARLFDLARLDSERVVIQPEPFALGDLVQDVVQGFELEAQAREVAIAASVRADLRLVMADIGLIERVLRNLIENALRYAGRGGTVTVAAAPERDGVAIEVRDSGAGIPADELARIFDRFYRVEKSRGLSDGSAGLGLAIAKRILELHESDIAVTSEPGRTVFRFCVRYADQERSDSGLATLSSDARSALTPSFHSTAAAMSINTAPSA
ncbi:MAG TPA: HAMP domain-containing sensor histidine kinase [Burkholderiales bacterium]|nr:HAMP domain-containing sensor histidine kinase [Burkholderiales bacterium]